MLLQHTCTVCTRALVSTHRLACILRPSTCEWIAASAAVHLCCRQLTYEFVGVLTFGSLHWHSPRMQQSQHARNDAHGMQRTLTIHNP